MAIEFSTETSKIKALIKRRHPEYEKYEDHWQFLEETYSSDRDWFSNHIFSYIKEGVETHKGRIQRAYRFNHTREIVDLVNKYLFKAEIARSEDVSAEVQAFWDKSTLGGLDIEQFMRQVSSRASRSGRIYIVVDNNHRGEDGEVLSIAEARQAGLKVFAYMVGPQEVLDMSYGEDGELEWILIQETYRDDNDPFDSSGKLIPRYRLWTKDGWALYEKNGKKDPTLIDKGDHALGVVPVIPVDHVETAEKWRAPALIDDIAYLDRAVANYLSNLDQIIQDQTFSQLIIPAQALMQSLLSDDTNEAEKEVVRKKLLDLGTNQVLVFDGEGNGEPKYISPDPRQAELVVKVIKQIINEIYHTVGLAGERTKQDNALGIDNSSGVAKAFDFERVNALLTAKANSLENAEKRLVQMVQRWLGEEVDNDELPKVVDYPKSFDTRGIAQEFEIAASLQMLDMPISIRKHQAEQLVKKLYPLLPAAIKKEMEKELKDWEPGAVAIDTGFMEPSRQGQNTGESDGDGNAQEES